MRSEQAGYGVFVVDDHEMVRRGLRALFADVGGLRVVGEAADVASALRLIPQADPDVLVVDQRLPDGRGVDVLHGLEEPHASLPWLLLTAFDLDDDDLGPALRRGASAVVVKRARSRELVDTVCRVAAGEDLVGAELRARAAAAIGSPVDDPLAVLTRREREVLELIGEGLSNRQIAGRLTLTEKTVKNHVTGLLAKLDLDRRTQAAALITRHHATRTTAS